MHLSQSGHDSGSDVAGIKEGNVLPSKPQLDGPGVGVPHLCGRVWQSACPVSTAEVAPVINSQQGCLSAGNSSEPTVYGGGGIGEREREEEGGREMEYVEREGVRVRIHTYTYT